MPGASSDVMPYRKSFSLGGYCPDRAIALEEHSSPLIISVGYEGTLVSATSSRPCLNSLGPTMLLGGNFSWNGLNIILTLLMVFSLAVSDASSYSLKSTRFAPASGQSCCHYSMENIAPRRTTRRDPPPR